MMLALLYHTAPFAHLTRGSWSLRLLLTLCRPLPLSLHLSTLVLLSQQWGSTAACRPKVVALLRLLGSSGLQRILAQ